MDKQDQEPKLGAYMHTKRGSKATRKQATEDYKAEHVKLAQITQDSLAAFKPTYTERENRMRDVHWGWIQLGIGGRKGEGTLDDPDEQKDLCEYIVKHNMIRSADEARQLVNWGINPQILRRTELRRYGAAPDSSVERAQERKPH